jgi:DUF971 family protein
MKELKPKKISRNEKSRLNIIWNDGFETEISLKDLRDNCPCALCKEGNTKKSKFDEWVEGTLKEKRNILMEIEPIGNYALKLKWGDGHDSGLYRYEYLRGICERYNLKSANKK